MTSDSEKSQMQKKAPETVDFDLASPGLASSNKTAHDKDDGYDSDTMIAFRKDVDKQMVSMKKEAMRKVEERL